jgi:hypothetical protein
MVSAPGGWARLSPVDAGVGIAAPTAGAVHMVNGGSTEVDGPGGRRGGPAPLLPGSVAPQTGALPGGGLY